MIKRPKGYQWIRGRADITKIDLTLAVGTLRYPRFAPQHSGVWFTAECSRWGGVGVHMGVAGVHMYVIIHMYISLYIYIYCILYYMRKCILSEVVGRHGVPSYSITMAVCDTANLPCGMRAKQTSHRLSCRWCGILFWTSSTLFRHEDGVAVERLRCSQRFAGGTGPLLDFVMVFTPVHVCVCVCEMGLSDSQQKFDCQDVGFVRKMQVKAFGMAERPLAPGPVWPP